MRGLIQTGSDMAGKTIEMSKVKQVLQWYRKGDVSNRKIAEIVGLNKETVNTYINKAKSDPLSLDDLLAMDEYVLDVRFRGGSPSYTDYRFENFKAMLPYFEQQMDNPKNHMTLLLLWEEYAQKYPNDHYSLTQFRFHYRQNTAAKKRKITTVLADLHQPGEKIYLDFSGDTLSYTDIETGEIVKVQTFVGCLPATDYTYAIAVPSQGTEDFVYAFVQCLRHLQGVPKVIVPDNLKSAVIKADRYEPALNKLMDDMANHYGAVVLPARVRRPQDKANVEGMVKTLYHRVYAPLRNQQFYSLEELNRAIAEQTLRHNQKRMQLHPFSREERFLSVEKPILRPLPKEDFEIRHTTNLKVQCNCCILLGRDKHYYSVPYQYVGQQVLVDYTRTLVKIYAEGQCVATHRRNHTQGRYTIVNDHLASKSAEWRSRSKEYYVSKASKAMTELATLISHMFITGNQAEEVYYRSCDALLHLQKQTDPILFREACMAALDNERYSYSFVNNIIKSKGVGIRKKKDVKAPNPSHSNVRGPQSFK